MQPHQTPPTQLAANQSDQNGAAPDDITWLRPADLAAITEDHDGEDRLNEAPARVADGDESSAACSSPRPLTGSGSNGSRSRPGSLTTRRTRCRVPTASSPRCWSHS